MRKARNQWVLMGIVLLLIFGYSLTAAAGVQHITTPEAVALIQKNQDNPAFVILDVRTPAEFARGHIAGAQLLDYKSNGFSEGLKRLHKAKTYLIYCRTGNRSRHALQLMEKMGFESIYHLSSGITDWTSRKLPLVKK